MTFSPNETPKGNVPLVRKANTNRIFPERNFLLPKGVLYSRALNTHSTSLYGHSTPLNVHSPSLNIDSPPLNMESLGGNLLYKRRGVRFVWDCSWRRGVVASLVLEGGGLVFPNVVYPRNKRLTPYQRIIGKGQMIR